MTAIPLARCCEARNAADVSSRNDRTKLIFHVFMFAFLNQDLDSLLSNKRKHDQRAKRVSPPQVHGIAHQRGDEQNEREIRIAERENCRRFQRLTSQLYCK